ncbi:MAG: flagellar basal body rod protein FlgB [Clostridiales bacterium]|nr:flagellar basal body rod protein FlgB [Clostridiales bacterium]
MWERLFASTDLLQKGMEAAWLRNTVIRNNLANSETPGFKSSDVKFETLFKSALEGSGFTGKRTRDKHIQVGRGSLNTLEPKIVENKKTSMRMDGNNVDVESENVKLAQNSIQHNALLYKLNSELSRIRMAISEGSR